MPTRWVPPNPGITAAQPPEFQSAVEKIVVSHTVNELYGLQLTPEGMKDFLSKVAESPKEESHAGHGHGGGMGGMFAVPDQAPPKTTAPASGTAGGPELTISLTSSWISAWRSSL